MSGTSYSINIIQKNESLSFCLALLDSIKNAKTLNNLKLDVTQLVDARLKIIKGEIDTKRKF